MSDSNTAPLNKNTSKSISKLTKAQLFDLIDHLEEDKYSVLKIELGLPYHTDEEWIEYIKKLQTQNADRLNDCEELIKRLRAQLSIVH